MAKSSKPRKKKPGKISAEEKILREVNKDLKEAHDRSAVFIPEAKERLAAIRHHVEVEAVDVDQKYRDEALEVITKAENDYKELEKRHEEIGKKIKEDLKRVNVKDEVEVAQFVLEAPIKYAEFAEDILNYASNVDSEIRRVDLKSQGLPDEQIEKILTGEAVKAAEETKEVMVNDEGATEQVAEKTNEQEEQA